MKIDVIVGGLYGDEGKGKIVSNLGQNDYDYIMRVNASTNASHTVKLENGEIFVTKQLPSVFHNDKVKFVIGPGAILNLNALKQELLTRSDLNKLTNRVCVASSISLLINPYIEKNKNSDSAKKYGSTNQGTGNAVLARVDRHSIKLSDVMNASNNLISREEFTLKVKETCELLDYHYFKTKSFEYYQKEANSILKDYQEIIELIGDFTVDYTNFLYSVKENSKILIEGCNGIMLDNLHGLNPYTTSASTSLNALLNGANLSPYYLGSTYIIITGYFCCLNKRPFLTEMTLEEAEKLYKYNSEIDDAEGMKRRLGWFDLPTVKKSLIGHKRAKLILNKLDIMKDLSEIKICDYYLTEDNEKIYIMPDDMLTLTKLKPHYFTIKGWGSLDNIKEEKDVPKELKEFINYIEKETGNQIAYLGIGRKVNDLIKYSCSK